MIYQDETIDTLGFTDLRLIQPKTGYRFSMDPFLLCGFSAFKDERTVYDLGCGNGVISLLAAAQSLAVRVVGIERQPQMVQRAQRSVALNDMVDRVSILEGDLRRIQELCPPQDADLVLANPPFRIPENGRIAGNPERAAARHELAGGIEDFLSAAAYVLKAGGRCCLVLIPERLAEVLSTMPRHGINPSRLRMVHHTPASFARVILLEGVKERACEMVVEPPLIISDKEGRGYSAEVMTMYQGSGRPDTEHST